MASAEISALVYKELEHDEECHQEIEKDIFAQLSSQVSQFFTALLKVWNLLKARILHHIFVFFNVYSRNFLL